MINQISISKFLKKISFEKETNNYLESIETQTDKNQISLFNYSNYQSNSSSLKMIMDFIAKFRIKKYQKQILT
jgi:hypothetical protein